MLTIQKLREFGANVDEALVRCANNEGFYLMLLEKALKSPDFDKLKDALEQKDLESGFEFAHSLKGVFANLSVTPILEPLCEMTELLRGRIDTDYTPLLNQVFLGRNMLLEML